MRTEELRQKKKNGVILILMTSRKMVLIISLLSIIGLIDIFLNTCSAETCTDQGISQTCTRWKTSLIGTTYVCTDDKGIKHNCTCKCTETLATPFGTSSCLAASWDCP
ncbi:MAG: hypothetical protein H0U75_06140 [Legionella sp.]|nr:hypothetical protein [Legionella sp.]